MPRPRPRIVGWLATGVLASALACMARGELIVLKNGQKIRGKIVARTDKTIKVKVTRYGVTATRSLPRAEIESILENGEAPARKGQGGKAAAGVGQPQTEPKQGEAEGHEVKGVKRSAPVERRRSRAKQSKTVGRKDRGHAEPKSGPLEGASFDSLFDKILEVKDGQTSKRQIALYERLVKPLPADAARWILQMGQFIEDRKITRHEEELLKHLAKPKVRDPLVYLTHPEVMDGVDKADVEDVKQWSPTKGAYLYLGEDLKQLQARSLVKREVRPKLTELVAKADRDFEIRKGLYLIFNYGRPPPDLRDLAFNTQFLMLCHLLRYGIPQGQERLAVAAALVYGSVLTVAEESLWPRIVEFARHRLDYISETHRLLKAQGADWDARDYPLQACIGLLWGGICQVRAKGKETNLGTRFRKQPMKADEFAFFFVRANTIVQMRDWLLAQGAFSRQQDLLRFAQKNSELAQNYESKLSAAAELAIRLSWELDRCHPDFPTYDVNWQWTYHKTSGLFAGACQNAGEVGSFLIRSLNIPALQRSHAFWHYIPRDGVWRMGASELLPHLKGQNRDNFTTNCDRVAYHKATWDNFHLGVSDIFQAESLMVFYLGENASWVRNGIPSAYLFRKSLPCSWFKRFWKDG